MARSFSDDFQGTDRFQLKDRLGTGTSGEVYCVYDTKLRTFVALKTLHRADPAAIFRFKNEFRALADVNHPNLVQLYELLLDGQRWFFTMELVDGLDFLEYCRGELAHVDEGEGGVPMPPPDLGRLRAALRQLAVGLAGLHRAGKLHCDIKPSNIRVTHEGRVVLLDFGLVQELFPGHGELTLDAELAGTPAYMAPEQAAGQRLTEAADWYAVGVVLYEALTGRRPYYGTFLEVLQHKQTTDPTPPGDLLPDLPQDLTKLCQRLLCRDPGERPTGERVLRMLGDSTTETQRSTLSSSAVVFVGRDQHLAALSEAFERTRQGQAVVVYVHGSSGMGKSALISQFLKQIRHENEEIVVLSGRCYERESVPYKALDSLVDALSHYLMRLPKQEAEVVLPTNVQALARLFPALRRVQAVVRSQRRVLEIPDEREQKRRARTALRELLQRLAARHPLVLFIDDLQWGDRDSAHLISELLRPPDPPPLLFVGSYRSEEKGSSPLLQELARSQQIHEGAHVRELPVEELSGEGAEDLALRLFGDRSEPLRAVARVIARESQGSPYFVAELVRYARLQGEAQEAGSGVQLVVDSAGMTLERLILSRLLELTPEATRLLEVVAVAGQPIELRVVIQAVELGIAAQAAVTALRAASLIRIRRSHDFDEIEPYHDRIREAVLSTLDPSSRGRYHHNLALALEASGRADPETLAVHFRESGEREREAQFVVSAAEKASQALAFDRAARLYRRALELETATGAARRELLVLLGDALTNAGRGVEASRVYLEAVPGAQAAEALELRRRAAEQQLMSGYIDDGLETIRQVLESIGITMPRTPTGILVSLLWQRLRLKLRGLKFKERDSSQIPQDRLIRIDTCRSVAIGLSNVYPIRGTDFATRHVLLALEAGEPYRIARALGTEAGFSAVEGTESHKRTAGLLQASMRLAERVNQPDAIALTHIAAGLAAYLEGEGNRARESWERAEDILRNQCTGVVWELATLVIWRYRLAYFQGHIQRLFEDVPGALKDFMERGDTYGEAGLRSNVGWFLRLAADRPDDALAEIKLARDRWAQKGFQVNDYLHLVGRVEIALYRGDAAAAWADLEATWPELVRSLLLRIQVTRSEALHLRCRAALAALAATGRGSPHLSPSGGTLDGKRIYKVLRKSLRRLDRQVHPWSKPYANLLHAGLATLEGRRDRALDHLVAAAAGFDSSQMGLYAAVSRRRRGQLLGKMEGQGFVTDADEWIRGQGIQRPEAIADALAPGVWEP